MTKHVEQDMQSKTSQKEATFVDILSLSKKENRPDDLMVENRQDEPDYAKLRVSQHDSLPDGKPDTNRYGNKIVLINEGQGDSLGINHDFSIGENPNRNKQHGFHFTADNCIGCHACESACSEKNDLPNHFAFRSVGYVEGGSFPDHQRMNISMACNHCDNPVCLKGCPTRAYTKHPEYGAVIQDPDICFGCGYCTWVCPYNAPQLDPVAGQVEKCNMCVDRLEVGLKPACVSACVGNALDFGVIEDMPEQREQIDTRIPGFPDPNITHPNIRFQQLKDMPDEVSRTDSMPLKYEKDASLGHYKPVVDQKLGKEKHWNLQKLSSSENPLVLFTLSVQCALGLFFALTLGSWFGVDAIQAAKASDFYLLAVVVCLGLSAIGLLMSTSHIGKPLRFYRGFNNLRHSPVSREGLGIFLFMAFLGLHLASLVPLHNGLMRFLENYVPFVGNISEALNIRAWTWLAAASEAFAALSITAGAVGLYYMYRCYRIPARPFWDHISTGTHFVGNAISLGALSLVVLFCPVLWLLDFAAWNALFLPVACLVAIGLSVELTGLALQNYQFNRAEHEGAASHYIQKTTFGKTYVLRNGLLIANLSIALSLIVINSAISAPTFLSLVLLFILFLGSAATALIGRSLFYILVIPTTMPGAFFWKNKGFEEHARDIGLDHNPNSGVVPLRH